MGTESPSEDGLIFAEKRVLDSEYLPTDRFVGRDEEIASIKYAVTPTVFGNQPENILVYGPRGTGKTTCTTFSVRREIQNAREQGVRAGFAYVNLTDHPTKTKVTRVIAEQLNDPSTAEVSVPKTGLSLEEYRTRLRTVLDARYDVALVVLDRMDRVAEAGTLLESALTEETDSTACAVGVVGIFDGCREDAPVERSDGSPWQSYAEFEPYDTAELIAILESRTDAFVDGAVDDEAISRAAAIAAEAYGNARTAIDLLRSAGELAAERGVATVTAEMVQRVADGIEESRIREAVAPLPLHSQLALLALASVSSDRSQESFRTTTIQEAYERICKEHDTRPRTLRRLQDFLNEHDDLGLTRSTRRWGGRGEGNYKTHRLLVDPDAVMSALPDP